jgi:hypothetical protein
VGKPKSIGIKKQPMKAVFIFTDETQFTVGVSRPEPVRSHRDFVVF